MMNCADKAATMSLWEYEARLWHWNDAHGGGEEEQSLPDPRTMQGMVDDLNAELHQQR